MIRGNKVTVIIPAAGKGRRMNSNVSKQFIKVNNKEILAYTIDVFEKLWAVDNIIIITSEEDIEYVNDIKAQYRYKKVVDIVPGGRERQDSVYNGLQVVDKDADIVLIHDGARPMINEIDIINVIEEVMINRAAVLGVKVKDTIKVVNRNMDIVDTPDRASLYAVQTPQGFSKDLLISAYKKGIKSGDIVTDDAMMVEIHEQHRVKIVEGDYSNIKITTPHDLETFKYFLEKVSENC